MNSVSLQVSHFALYSLALGNLRLVKGFGRKGGQWV